MCEMTKMSDKELFISVAIGDGHVTYNGRLQLHHSILQKDYFEYKKEKLSEFGFVFSKNIIYEPNGFSKEQTIASCCKTTKLGKDMRLYLYPCGKKIIPQDLDISPFMWSIIYQDDGRQNKSNHYFSYRKGVKIIHNFEWVNRYTIYTDCFDADSIDVLIKSLYKYDINATINYSNKNKYPHIHIYDKKSKENFKNMILPFIHESMMYKLNLPTYIKSHI